MQISIQTDGFLCDRMDGISEMCDKNVKYERSRGQCLIEMVENVCVFCASKFICTTNVNRATAFSYWFSHIIWTMVE